MMEFFIESPAPVACYPVDGLPMAPETQPFTVNPDVFHTPYERCCSAACTTAPQRPPYFAGPISSRSRINGLPRCMPPTC